MALDVERILKDSKDGNLESDDADKILGMVIRKTCEAHNIDLKTLSFENVFKDPKSAILFVGGALIAMGAGKRKYLCEEETNMVVNFTMALSKLYEGKE